MLSLYLDDYKADKMMIMFCIHNYYTSILKIRRFRMCVVVREYGKTNSELMVLNY